MDESIERLEQKIEHLLEMNKMLTQAVKEIYQALDLHNQSQAKKEYKLYQKKEVNWTELIKAVVGTNSENFVMNVYNNDYPTLTENQYNALSDIASEFNIKLEL